MHETLHTISYRESTSMVHLLDRMSQLRGVSRSEYMRQAIRAQIAADVAETGDDYYEIMEKHGVKPTKTEFFTRF